MAGLAHFVRDEVSRPVVDMLEAAARGESCPEVVEGMSVGPEALPWFEMDAPDPDPLVYRQEA